MCYMVHATHYINLTFIYFFSRTTRPAPFAPGRVIGWGGVKRHEQPILRWRVCTSDLCVSLFVVCCLLCIRCSVVARINRTKAGKEENKVVKCVTCGPRTHILYCTECVLWFLIWLNWCAHVYNVVRWQMLYCFSVVCNQHSACNISILHHSAILLQFTCFCVY